MLTAAGTITTIRSYARSRGGHPEAHRESALLLIMTSCASWPSSPRFTHSSELQGEPVSRHIVVIIVIVKIVCPYRHLGRHR